jgi:sporulation protein YlmC with PRC-barrel domain/ElaB/YqjD/DUF883 family membrane-anchored ribosome-binding protein
MRLNSRFLAATALVSMMSAVPALASEGKTDGGQEASTRTATEMGLGISAQRMIGAEVRNRQGDELGNMHDIILAMDGRAEQAVVSVGGYLGVGEKLVVVPYDSLTFARDHAVLATASRQDLEQRPAFPYPEDRLLLVVAGSQANEKSNDMDEYLRQAKQEMQEWQNKVDAYAEKARRKGSEAAKEAKQSMEAGWSKVQEQWQRLENASQEAWEETRQGYENARDAFQKEWNKTTSGG